jgi:hypothetical protein
MFNHFDYPLLDAAEHAAYERAIAGGEARRAREVCANSSIDTA